MNINKIIKTINSFGVLSEKIKDKRSFNIVIKAEILRKKREMIRAKESYYKLLRDIGVETKEKHE